MAKFLNDAALVPLHDGKNWRLSNQLQFEPDGLMPIIVPEGFVTDLASVPRLFWNILPPFGEYTEAAIVHDWLYRNNFFDRETCDKVLLQGMIACEVPPWKITVIYRAVRMFGWKAWNDDKRKIP